MLNSLSTSKTMPSDKTLWSTPASLFSRLHSVFHFTLDGAAVESNAKLPRFCCPPAEFMRLGNEYGILPDPSDLTTLHLPDNRTAFCDGLESHWAPGIPGAWEPERVWLNPPYGKEIAAHLAHAVREARTGALVVALIPVDPSTRWWHEHVEGVAEVHFLAGRVQFEGATGSPNFANAVAIYWPAGFWRGA